MGTAQYLSPEQAAGQEALPASDVYALGVVAYECLAGHRPFERDSAVAVAIAHVQDPPPPLPPDIPPPVAALVMRMLAKDPADRFPDGASLAAGLSAVRSGSALPPTGAYAIRVPSAAAPAAYRAASRGGEPVGCGADGTDSGAGLRTGALVPTAGALGPTTGPVVRTGGALDPTPGPCVSTAAADRARPRRSASVGGDPSRSGSSVHQSAPGRRAVAGRPGWPSSS